MPSRENTFLTVTLPARNSRRRVYRRIARSSALAVMSCDTSPRGASTSLSSATPEGYLAAWTANPQDSHHQ